MQRRLGYIVTGLVMALLAACVKKEESPKAPETPSSAPVAVQTSRAAPDFGGVIKVTREVEAIGSTPELALVSALQSAVAQVNGVKVASQLQSLRQGVNVAVDGQQTGDVRAEAFAQKLVSSSQGLVLGYDIISQEEITKLDEETMAKVRASDGGFSYSASASAESQTSIKADAEDAAGKAVLAHSAENKEKASIDIQKGASSFSSDVTTKKMHSYWKLKVRAEIAQFHAPDEKGRPKIVVALPKTLVQSYSVGDGRVQSIDVAQAVRGRLSDILTNTKRFIVLDREFGADLQAEIDHINSGNVRVQDNARLGQQLATDLILLPTIERFEYLKSVRKLRMSDRDLVSYAGGGRITLRLLNTTTGQVVMSNSFDHKLANADPSTMPRFIDGKSMATQMMDSLAEQIGTAIVTEIFPISVVSLSGDQVVLSQGGDALHVGDRWSAVMLGDELKDPQTGNSLGRTETPIGTIRIDRVAPQTSYGTIEEGAVNLGGKQFSPGAIELRDRVKGRATEHKVAANEGEEKATPVQKATPAATPKHVSGKSSSTEKSKPAEPANDDKW